MNEQSIVDKTMRSVFVGNIPYEVSEEKLKDIFSEVGSVLSFKLVFDRDSGKPKGYGFCEYKDQETALCAMRNLNNYEIAGRNLRVDNACTEKSRLEMQSLMQNAQVESTYGESVTPDKAPEMIGKVVASMPPEQMYELLKQMKLCILNNPTEGRQMLLQNPQLSYALLQVMIIMKIVDPATALSMLHPANKLPTALSSTSTVTTASTTVNNVSTTNVDHNVVSSSDTKPMNLWNNVNNVKPPVTGPPAPLGAIQPPPIPLVTGQDFDMRAQPVNRFADSDLRNLQMPAAFPPVDMFKRDPRLQQISENMPSFQGLVPPPGLLPPPNMPLPLPMPGPGMSGPGMPGPGMPGPGMPGPGMPGSGMPVLPNIPRMVPPPTSIPHPNRTPQVSVSSTTPVTTVVTNTTTPNTSLLSAFGNDKDKADLIMRVLKLTDEEIATLPLEHRQSILALKDQITKSASNKR